MVTRGGVPSSLTMVPVAVPSPMVVPALALESRTVKFSSTSGPTSPSTLTVIVVLVSPLAKLTWPESGAKAVKSPPPRRTARCRRRPNNRR